MKKILTKSLSFNALLLLVFIFLLPVALYSEEDEIEKINEKQITVSPTFVNFASLDLLYSYSVYSGRSLAPNIRVESQGDKFYESSDIRLTLIPRYPSADVSPDEPYYGRLAYLLSFIYEQQDMDCYLIPSISNDHSKIYAVINYHTYVNLGVNAQTMPELLMFSVGPGVGYSFDHGRHHFRASLATNLLAYTCRNNYGSGVTQDYERMNYFKFIIGNSMIQTPFSLQTLLAGLNYDVDINEKLFISAHYDFRFIHNNKPRNLVSSSGHYSMGIGFKL